MTAPINFRSPAETGNQGNNLTIDQASKTVSDVINARFETLTRAEKQLAGSLLDNYPVSGLGSITTVADNAGVSTPTVARMVQKLGYRGFPDFQSRLHHELEATLSNPIAKHDRWAANAPGTHILNRFADAIMSNMRQTLSQVETAEFDGAAALVADRKRSVYIVGERGVEIVLFTDQWATPVAKGARFVFRVHIEAPSAWDSSVVTLFIVEALIETVQSTTWDETRDRMKELEGLFEASRLFRKPR